ncbi:hypothetical protein Tco_1509606 [Tanacetum coccineum]
MEAESERRKAVKRGCNRKKEINEAIYRGKEGDIEHRLLSIKNPSEGDTYPVQWYLSCPADLYINNAHGMDRLQPWLLDAEPRSRRTHNTAVDRKEREEQSKHTQGISLIDD